MLILNCGVPSQNEQCIILQIVHGFKKLLLLMSNNRVIHPYCTHKCTTVGQFPTLSHPREPEQLLCCHIPRRVTLSHFTKKPFRFLKASQSTAQNPEYVTSV